MQKLGSALATLLPAPIAEVRISPRLYKVRALQGQTLEAGSAAFVCFSPFVFEQKHYCEIWVTAVKVLKRKGLN